MGVFNDGSMICVPSGHVIILKLNMISTFLFLAVCVIIRAVTAILVLVVNRLGEFYYGDLQAVWLCPVPISYLD